MVAQGVRTVSYERSTPVGLRVKGLLSGFGVRVLGGGFRIRTCSTISAIFRPFSPPSSSSSTENAPTPAYIRGNRKVTSGGASWVTTVVSTRLYWARPICIQKRMALRGDPYQVDAFERDGCDHSRPGRDGVSGLGCGVSGFGLRVSGFGFRISGFGFRISKVHISAFRVENRAPPEARLTSFHKDVLGRVFGDLAEY